MRDFTTNEIVCYPYFPSDSVVTEGPRGITVVHILTGTQISVGSERSQLQNKVKALKGLKAAVYG